MTEPTIRDVQSKLPWALGYSEAFSLAAHAGTGMRYSDASTMEHLDFQHALIHVVKATGKLAAMIENADHWRQSNVDPNPSADHEDELVPDNVLTDFPRRDVEKYLADLVICAMRMANTRPGGEVDLWAAVLRRIDSKNGSSLAQGGA